MYGSISNNPPQGREVKIKELRVGRTYRLTGQMVDGSRGWGVGVPQSYAAKGEFRDTEQRDGGLYVLMRDCTLRFNGGEKRSSERFMFPHNIDGGTIDKVIEVENEANTR